MAKCVRTDEIVDHARVLSCDCFELRSTPLFRTRSVDNAESTRVTRVCVYLSVVYGVANIVWIVFDLVIFEVVVLYTVHAVMETQVLC